ncbi:SpoIIE family protein phosphatase [Streptomyces sp. NPDC086835]|uniref:SpoIIE family protein phosphatase n=1 Tax=Streptomyces sp. NPDC086835 TaxID=3365761 RepID=UPI00381B0ED5
MNGSVQAAGTWDAASAWRTWRPVEGEDLRGPLDIAVAATVVLDARNRVIGWSPAAEALLGYGPEDILGRPVDVFLCGTALAAGSPADLSEPAPASAASPGAPPLPPRLPAPAPAGAQGLPFHGHEPRLARHRDGHGVPVEAAVSELADGGTAARVLVLAESERLRVWESRLAMLDGLATQSPIGLAIYDTDLRLAWANAASSAEIGRPFAQYRGTHADELYPGGTLVTEGYPRTLDGVMRQVLDTGEPVLDVHFLGQLPSDPGKEHLWSCSYYRLEDAEGRVLGVCEDAFDITDRYDAQNRLALLVEAGRRIGTTLDAAVTAQELADVAVPAFASAVEVDIAPGVLEGGDPGTGGPPRSGFVRVARAPARAARTVLDYPPGTPQLRSLSSGGKVLDENALVVPLRAGSETLGLVTFTREGRPAVFDNGEVALADELVARAAVCIDNARRFTREHAAALTLQRELLPQRLPWHSAVEVAHRYLPTDGATGVGGDWFDLIPLSGARVGLVVGDVVGHGLPAAVTMGRLRTTVEALAELDMAPDELLARLDDLVVPATDAFQGPGEGGPGEAAGAYVAAGPHPDVTTGATCIYAVYDPVSGRCTMARAGHLPPVVVTMDGSYHYPELPAGPPLGLGGLPFESMEIGLPAGSLLALFTDGLVEARDRDIDERLDMLGHVLAAHRDMPLEELCDRVVTELLPGGTTADDTALLLVRTREFDAGQVAMWELPAEAVAAGRARELITGQLNTWGLEELAFSTELVVSELVTNAVRYAEGPLQLRLIRDRTLLCEVADTGHTSPHLRHSTAEDEGGRGLFIVAQLVQRWGTRYTRSGKTIWTEQAFPDGVPTA